MAITYDENLSVQSAGGITINLPIAGLGSRSYAFVIDWHIRLLLAMAWFIAAVFIVRIVNSAGGKFFDLSSSSWDNAAYWGTLPALIIYLFYHPVLEIVMKGRTPGKRMVGVRIVSADGSAPSLSAIVIRNLFRIIDNFPNLYLVGIASCFVTKKQVRIGDIAAHTVLVHEEKMKDKSIEFISDASRDSVFNHNQIEVLHDLLDRWKDLGRTVRVDLGKQLLAIASQTLTDDLKEAKLDKEIHRRLLELSEGNNGA